jgi:hypothetical protein
MIRALPDPRHQDFVVADGPTVAQIVREYVACESRLETDQSRLYKTVGAEFSGPFFSCGSSRCQV